MKKVVIVGASIAGATAAILLAKKFDVRVYEKKKIREIGNKLCGNVVTSLFGKIIKKYGLDEEKFIKTRYCKAVFYSPNNRLELPTEEYEINRGKFIEALIAKAKSRGAKFYFGTEFKRNLLERSDYVIGADGALSTVAKEFKFPEKDQFLVIQTDVKKKEVRNFDLSNDAYHVFVGRKFGHYAYAFPSGNKIKIGFGDHSNKNVKRGFEGFLKYLGVKKTEEVRGAFIPIPKFIGWKKDAFLIGDAGGFQKFSGGGIIPAMLSAEALNEYLISGKKYKLKKLKRSTRHNYAATFTVRRFNDSNWDRFLEIMKGKKFRNLVANRDCFKRKDHLVLFSPKMIGFIVKTWLFG